MSNSEKGIEGKSTPDRAGTLLIGLFALVALLFGLMHLGDALTVLVKALSRRYSVFTFHTQAAIIFIDLVFGVASLPIAVGLFFRKEWARKAWLVFLSFMLVVWLHLMLVFSLKLRVLRFFAGYSVSKIWPWIVMLILVSIISWAYLSKARIKARFH